ncbi:hypothetical protein ACFL6U_06915 [Planctomycetota bacterium]
MKNQNDELADLLGELDPPYESLEELRIGKVLDRYGVPFFYKQPSIIYNEGKNEIWKPSFTMYSYGGAVVDYVADKCDNPGERILSKDRIYKYNQVPAVLLGPKDLEKPKWDRDLYEKLEQVYRQAFDPTKYTPAGIEQSGKYSH